MTERGIPPAGSRRTAWLDKLYAERTCDTSRGLVDAVATTCAELDALPIDEYGERHKLFKLIGELMSRAVAADKHAEVLETQWLREQAEKQRELESRQGGLH